MLFNPAPGNGSRGFLFSAGVNLPALNSAIGVVPDGAFASRSMQSRIRSERRASFQDSVEMQIFDTLLPETAANRACFRALMLACVRRSKT